MELGGRHINDYLDNPSLVEEINLDELEQALADFPWAPELHAIHARKLHTLEDVRYAHVLATASLYAPDRKWLKSFVKGEQKAPSIKKTIKRAAKLAEASLKAEQEREEEAVIEVKEEKEPKETPKTEESKRESEKVEEKKNKSTKKDVEIAPLNLEEEADIESEVAFEAAKTAHQEAKVRDIDTSGTDSFMGWLNRVAGDIKAHDEEQAKKAGQEPKEEKPEAQEVDSEQIAGETEEEELATPPSDIDDAVASFIQAQQAMRRRDSQEVEEQPEAIEKSIESSEEIISETLAGLLEKQGKNDHAIDMYQKLQLKYPEKKAFFAARIEEIQKLKQ